MELCVGIEERVGYEFLLCEVWAHEISLTQLHTTQEQLSEHASGTELHIGVENIDLCVGYRSAQYEGRGSVVGRDEHGGGADCVFTRTVEIQQDELGIGSRATTQLVTTREESAQLQVGRVDGKIDKRLH